MNRRIRTRLVVTFLLTVLSIYLFAGFPPSLSTVKERIHLGLDLKGGILLQLQVVTEDAVRAETDLAIEKVRTLLQKENTVTSAISRTSADAFALKAVDSAKGDELRKALLSALPDWEIVANPAQPASFRVVMKSGRVRDIRTQAVDQEINIVRNRIDRLGVSEPVIQKLGGAGGDEISIQLPGVDDPERVKSMIQSIAQLELKLVEKGPFPSEEAARAGAGGTIPSDMELLPSKESGENAVTYYLVNRVASVTGRDLRDAYVVRDDNGHPAVGFSLTAEGAQRFERATEQNVGRRLAIVLDGNVRSAPFIDSRVSDSGIIKGGANGFPPQEARDLSLILRSGALPASMKYQRDERVSATLGAESIRDGVLAVSVALIAVVAFMVFYYREAGINATIAMILNVVMLLGAIAYFGVTLTLPGIAGVTLTVGVGIDSNVLIFERIREELRSGKTAVAAVAAGFNRVFITLVDTHLAALISAVFLFLFGTGPVKGFAVTLVIGLVSNMFTAVFVSRTLFEWILARRGAGAALSV